MSDVSEGLVLLGPDGGNPLGFLAALGTLRVASLVWVERRVRMGWVRRGTGWRPHLLVQPTLDVEELVAGLASYCRLGAEAGAAGGEREIEREEAFPHFAFDKNTSKIEPERFRQLALGAAAGAQAGDRTFADFLAAFGSEGCVDDGFVEDTAFRTMSGAGHQHFLGTMLNLAGEVRPEHVRSALLEPWRYLDPLSKLSMRWDPQDEKRYALQWRNPSGDPSRRKRGSVLGANRLAVEALPLFPAVPRASVSGRPRLATTGFDFRAREPHLTWPIWTRPATVEVCGSLLGHPALRELAADPPGRTEAWEMLRRMGVGEIFRSRRISVDYYRNFAPAEAI